MGSYIKPTGKKQIELVIDFLKRHKKNWYCGHSISKIFGVNFKSGSTIVSVLKRSGMVYVKKDKCSYSTFPHNLIRYKKGNVEYYKSWLKEKNKKYYKNQLKETENVERSTNPTVKKEIPREKIEAIIRVLEIILEDF